jgi:N-acetylmuramoyl-L-alanine amidase
LQEVIMAFSDQNQSFSTDPEPEPSGNQPGTAGPRSSSPRRTSSLQRRIGRFSLWNAIQIVVTYAFLAATLLTLFTPTNLFTGQMVDRLFSAWQANPTSIAQVTAQAQSTEMRIGIVAGHWKNDSGSVCADGLTEQEVNLKIATLVQQKLEAEGYTVDLLSEFDELL